MSRLPRVYMAGKIRHTDWRHSLFEPRRLRHVELHYDRQNDWIEPREILTVGGFEYAGPFFLGDDHGCFHGDNQHGLIDPGWADGHCQDEVDFPQVLSRRTVHRSCLHWLASSDVVFCWLDSLDAYGTLVELGYAHARGIPIYVATDGNVLVAHEDRIDAYNRQTKEHDRLVPVAEGGPGPWSDLWFAQQFCENFEHEWSIEGAWEGFLQWWGRRGWSPEKAQRKLWFVEWSR